MPTHTYSLAIVGKMGCAGSRSTHQSSTYRAERGLAGSGEIENKYLLFHALMSVPYSEQASDAWARVLIEMAGSGANSNSMVGWGVRISSSLSQMSVGRKIGNGIPGILNWVVGV